MAMTAWILFIFFSVVYSCGIPQPTKPTRVNEMEAGTVLFTMTESSSVSSSSTSWALTVISPSALSTYLSAFLQVQADSTTSSPTEFQVVLTKALDIEKIYDDTNLFLTLVNVRLTCTETTGPNQEFDLRYERFIFISPVSEFTPRLLTDAVLFNVSEDLTVGSQVLDLMEFAADDDIADEQDKSDVDTFHLETYTGQEVDGAGYFTVNPSGKVILSRPVDYESPVRQFTLNATVEDSGGLMSWSRVTIEVTNANDNAPTFVLDRCRASCRSVAEYRATVFPNTTGILTGLEPSDIKAVDQDGDQLTYDIVSGSPSDYHKFVSIDPRNGQVTLKQQLSNETISHLTLVIEVTDADKSKQGNSPSMPSHSAFASLLVFVSGRQVDFPAAPDSRTKSASWNEDALFISAMVLGLCLLFAIVALVVFCCKMRKMKQVQNHLRSNRCDTIKDRNPSDWNIQMRPVHQGSEKAFMRSLSNSTTSGGPGINNNGYERDEIFTTGVIPRATLQQSDRPTRSPTKQRVLSYHEAVTPFTSSVGQFNEDTTTHHGDSNTNGKHDVSVIPTSSTSDATRHSQSQRPSVDAQEDSTSSNLDSLYRALDVLTSVTPFPANPAELQPSPNHTPQPSSDLIREFEGITTTNEPKNDEDTLKIDRRKSFEALSSGNPMRNDANVLDRNPPRGDMEIDFNVQPLPMNEFFFDGSVHHALDQDHNTFKTSSSITNPFRSKEDTRSATDRFGNNSSNDNDNVVAESGSRSTTAESVTSFGMDSQQLNTEVIAL